MNPFKERKLTFFFLLNPLLNHMGPKSPINLSFETFVIASHIFIPWYALGQCPSGLGGAIHFGAFARI